MKSSLTSCIQSASAQKSSYNSSLITVLISHHPTPDLEPILNEVEHYFEISGDVPQSCIDMMFDCARYAQDLMIAGMPGSEAVTEATQAYWRQFLYSQCN